MSDPKDMPFLDHLEELRWRIIWSLLAIAVGALVGIAATIRFGLIEVLTEPLFSVIQQLAAEDPSFTGLLQSHRLVFLNLTEPLFFILRLGVLVGLVLASPVVAYHVWAFLAPALEERERKAIIPTFVLGLALFAAGVAMAYFVVLPMTIRFLLLFGSEWFTPALTAGFYMSMVIRLLLAFGLAFELPIVLLVLTALGLVSSSFLRGKRRHAVVGMAIVGSLVSPGDYIVVTVLMMLPLLVLYELGIILSAGVERRRGSPLDASEDNSTLLGALAASTYSWRMSRRLRLARAAR